MHAIATTRVPVYKDTRDASKFQAPAGSWLVWNSKQQGTHPIAQDAGAFSFSFPLE
jgi:hypothetical protein